MAKFFRTADVSKDAARAALPLLVVIAFPCGDATPECLNPPWPGDYQDPAGDLSAGPVMYEITDLPAGQEFWISANLYETASSPVPAAPGDLVCPPLNSVTVQEGTSVTLDLTLDRY